jgi:hypothetical protein
MLDATDLYEEAIRSANANGFVHNEALANELASMLLEASRKLPACICRTPVTLTYVGEPMAKYGNSNSFIRISATHQFLHLPSPLSARP